MYIFLNKTRMFLHRILVGRSIRPKPLTFKSKIGTWKPPGSPSLGHPAWVFFRALRIPGQTLKTGWWSQPGGCPNLAGTSYHQPQITQPPAAFEVTRIAFGGVDTCGATARTNLPMKYDEVSSFTIFYVFVYMMSPNSLIMTMSLNCNWGMTTAENDIKPTTSTTTT